LPTTLTRDRTTGKLALNGAPAVLRGGAYDLFFDPVSSPELIGKLGLDGVILPHLLDADDYSASGGNPCQPETDKAVKLLPKSWAETGNDFSAFFTAMRRTRCNFLRVFLTGGTLVRRTGPASICPFRRTLHVGGVRYDVRGAVERGEWEEAFFTRLRAFVQQADAAGVVVQLSLFNYYDLVADPAQGTTKTWSLSPWNAKNSLDAEWGKAHLIPDGTSAELRQREFVTPPTGRRTRLVQQKLIARVMQAVAGFRNVVLEVMNEPHQVNAATDLARVAEFDSFVVGTVVRQRPVTCSAALVSVNASFVFPANGAPPGNSDVDVWRDRPDLPHYADVDLVSYHGLTAMGKQSFAVCGGVTMARVDDVSIDARADRHLPAHPRTALLFSTDSVIVQRFEHVYLGGAIGMNVRDGQIRPVPESSSLEAQLLRSHVYHWALRCFQRGKGDDLGRLHFHNHSTFRQALVQISKAAAAAGLQPAIAPLAAALEQQDPV
jgi:hypothetical protein